MKTKTKTPLIAICGRPNVGKSTLFNRITGKQRAIVHSDEGITRDRTYGKATWNDRAFRIVDTGGVVEHPLDVITQKMQEQVDAALAEADIVVFVVDGQQEITRVDELIRDELLKLRKPVILAVNKLDNHKLTLNKVEYYSLGVGEPYAISSTHALGIDELLEAVFSKLQPRGADDSVAVVEEEGEITKVAVIGKPNVGKSSFINAILNEDRTIVTDVPGTTRDAVNIEFRWQDKEYVFIDTAGMRKKAQIRRDVERYSVNRALRAARFADVCLVMLDATEGLTEQDKRIFQFVSEAGKGMVLVWTKWDLIEDKEARLKDLLDQVDFKGPFLKYVPTITISNTTRLRIFKVFECIDEVATEAKKRISTAGLNRFIRDIREKLTPPKQGGKAPKILYATQASVKPTTFVLFVNQVRLFHFSYVRFIENQLREAYGFKGVPVTIELREEKPDAE